MKRKSYGGNINAKGAEGNSGNSSAKGAYANSGSAKRKTYGGGGNSKAKGAYGNSGNSSAKGAYDNSGSAKRKTYGGNTTIGKSKKRAGKRSGLRRSTKALLVMKQPWLDLILSGEKTWEIRGTQTTQRGKIHLSLSGGGGRIMGQCRVINSWAINKATLAKNFSKHRIDDLSIVNYARPHVWELSQARRYKQPFLYSHPRGATQWVKL